MKVLLLIFHPDLSKSRVNQVWANQFDTSRVVTTINDMYKLYPNFEFDIKKEQKDLMTHDKIVLQFPMYWYMSPPLLKKWFDDILEYGFAYGPANQLKGKDLQLIISLGGSRASYRSDGILDLIKPFQKIANYLEMNFMIPFWQYEVSSASQELISQFGNEWLSRLESNSPLEQNTLIDWITFNGGPKMIISRINA